MSENTILFALYRTIRRSFSQQGNVGIKKESRFGLIMMVIMVLSAFALKKWAPAAGLPKMAVPAVLCVSIGLVLCLLPYWNRTLLNYLGGGFAAIAIGLTAPFYPKEYFQPFAMCIAILGILSTAGIMRWQLNRRDHSSHRG